MSYASKDIRNIALLGHGGNGKTSLAESILFLTGSAAPPRATPSRTTTRRRSAAR